jgi:hypothetical protein
MVHVYYSWYTSTTIILGGKAVGSTFEVVRPMGVVYATPLNHAPHDVQMRVVNTNARMRCTLPLEVAQSQGGYKRGWPGHWMKINVHSKVVIVNTWQKC